MTDMMKVWTLLNASIRPYAQSAEVRIVGWVSP